MHKCTEGEIEWKEGGVCDGRVENGGDGEHSKGEAGEGRWGGSAAVERSERRLQSLLMGEIRLC